MTKTHGGHAAPESTRRARTRERLLDAAFEVFAEAGIEAASVEQITERAGFTRGAFYSNFTSKNELFTALLKRRSKIWTENLAAQVDVVLPAGDTSLLVTEGRIGPLLTQILAGPCSPRAWAMIQSEFRLLALRDPEFAQAFVADLKRFEESLAPITEEAASRAGRRFLLPAREVIRLVWAIYQETTTHEYLMGRSEAEASAAAGTAVTTILTRVTEPA